MTIPRPALATTLNINAGPSKTNCLLGWLIGPLKHEVALCRQILVNAPHHKPAPIFSGDINELRMK